MKRAGRMMVALLSVVAVLAMGIAAFAIFLQMQERDQRLGLESQLNLIRQERDDLKQQVATLNKAQDQIETELVRVKRELTDARDQLTQAISQQAVLSQSVEASKASEKELSELNNTVEQMSQELMKVQRERESLAQQVKALESERETLQKHLSAVQEEQTKLQQRLVELESVPTVELGKVLVGSEQDMPRQRTAGTGTPTTEFLPRAGSAPQTGALARAGSASGRVLVVNREYDFVVMDIGRNQGLAIGQRFQILRGNNNLGTVKVEKVYDDLAAAAILSDADSDAIREGDEVLAL